MTPDQRIDANIRAILQTARMSAANFPPEVIDSMREVMRRIMSESYTSRVNSSEDALSHVLNLRKEARK